MHSPLAAKYTLQRLTGISRYRIDQLVAAGVIPGPLPGTRLYRVAAVFKALRRHGIEQRATEAA